MKPTGIAPVAFRAAHIVLNDRGREQAAASGRLLARRQWDAIYASPLSRAFETASIIAAEVGLAAPAVVEAIVERNYGEAEGLTGDEMDRMFPGGADVPGRESREEVAARALAALHSLAAAHPGGALIVVSHGGLIRTVLNAVGRELFAEVLTPMAAWESDEYLLVFGRLGQVVERSLIAQVEISLPWIET